MASNTAAWLPQLKRPLKVDSAPYPAPGRNELVVKNHALALNPIDYIISEMGNIAFGWIKHPFILGSDVAGEVVAIGTGVNRFKVGDRIIGMAMSVDKQINKASHGAFQAYTLLLDHMASPIPDWISYESASVMPLGLSTAACGLFEQDQLALHLPSTNPKATGRTLLIWGGSTSVGCNAIQLAVSAGYEVITTASPRNFELVKKLGANQVFDYKSPTVINDIVRALEGKKTAGAFSIGNGAVEACMEILRRSKGDKFVAMATYPNPDPMPTSFVIPRIAFHYLSWILVNTIKSWVHGTKWKFIFGSSLAHNKLGEAIYKDYLPQALAQGRFVPAPEPMVIGQGLDKVQEGLDVLKQGVSAKKVVVSLS